MAEPYKEAALAGWGRLSPSTCGVYRPERCRDVPAVLRSGQHPDFIARGLGRSYGDAAVNAGGGVILMERMNRMLHFQEETGVLHCEGGVSLEEIIDVFLPRGFFLPVTPGTKFVTVGGAIANDVHGKNHHREGTFGRYVQELTLLTASGETLVCGPDKQADVFWATVGGIGLTGVITEAKVQLQRVQSAYVLVDYKQCADLDSALASLAELDEHFQYSVAWVDCLASGRNLGRSVLMHGNHAEPYQLPAGLAAAPFTVKHGLKAMVPFDLPEFVLNPPSIKAFNEVFYRSHPTRQGVVTNYDKYFYPLDGIGQWNRMYGKRGFLQYQATMPPDQKLGMVRLLERLSETKRASFLAVLKTFGAGGSGMLSHPMPGYTLTLDIPNHGEVQPFLREMERIVLDFGGRIYLAKDSSTTPEAFAAMYPRLEEFKAVQRRLDPEALWASDMARRLGLVAEKGDSQ